MSDSDTATPRELDDDGRLAIVKAHDYDRYISAVLSPPAVRDDVVLLYAFDAEIARIPRLVSEPLLGEIRLQWWRDSLAALLTDAGRAAESAAGAAATGHPLADALLARARSRRLPAGLIHGLIDARSAELSEAPLRDMGELWSYLDKTEGALVGLVARLLGSDAGVAAPDDIDTRTLAAGRAIGLTHLCRRVLAGQPQAELLVPLALWPLEERHTHAGDAEAEARFASGRERAVRRLLDLALEQADVARTQLSTLPRALRPAVLPLSLVPRYVRRLRGESDDPARPRGELGALRRLWTLWRASRRSNVL